MKTLVFSSEKQIYFIYFTVSLYENKVQWPTLVHSLTLLQFKSYFVLNNMNKLIDTGFNISYTVYV